MVRQVERVNVAWNKKMKVKTAMETWDGEGLSEALQN